MEQKKIDDLKWTNPPVLSAEDFRNMFGVEIITANILGKKVKAEMKIASKVFGEGDKHPDRGCEVVRGVKCESRFCLNRTTGVECAESCGAACQNFNVTALMMKSNPPTPPLNEKQSSLSIEAVSGVRLAQPSQVGNEEPQASQECQRTNDADSSSEDESFNSPLLNKLMEAGKILDSCPSSSDDSDDSSGPPPAKRNRTVDTTRAKMKRLAKKARAKGKRTARTTTNQNVPRPVDNSFGEVHGDPVPDAEAVVNLRSRIFNDMVPSVPEVNTTLHPSSYDPENDSEECTTGVGPDTEVTTCPTNPVNYFSELHLNLCFPMDEDVDECADTQSSSIGHFEESRTGALTEVATKAEESLLVSSAQDALKELDNGSEPAGDMQAQSNVPNQSNFVKEVPESLPLPAPVEEHGVCVEILRPPPPVEEHEVPSQSPTPPAPGEAPKDPTEILHQPAPGKEPADPADILQPPAPAEEHGVTAEILHSPALLEEQGVRVELHLPPSPVEDPLGADNMAHPPAPVEEHEVTAENLRLPAPGKEPEDQAEILHLPALLEEQEICVDIAVEDPEGADNIAHPPAPGKEPADPAEILHPPALLEEQEVPIQSPTPPSPVEAPKDPTEILHQPAPGKEAADPANPSGQSQGRSFQCPADGMDENLFEPLPPIAEPEGDPPAPVEEQDPVDIANPPAPAEEPEDQARTRSSTLVKFSAVPISPTPTGAVTMTAPQSSRSRRSVKKGQVNGKKITSKTQPTASTKQPRVSRSRQANAIFIVPAKTTYTYSTRTTRAGTKQLPTCGSQASHPPQSPVSPSLPQPKGKEPNKDSPGTSSPKNPRGRPKADRSTRYCKEHNMQFNHLNDYNKHMHIPHKKGQRTDMTITCTEPGCTHTCYLPTDMIRHMGKHKPRDQRDLVICRFCGRSFTRSSSLNAHLLKGCKGQHPKQDDGQGGGAAGPHQVI